MTPLMFYFGPWDRAPARKEADTEFFKKLGVKL